MRQFRPAFGLLIRPADRRQGLGQSGVGQGSARRRGIRSAACVLDTIGPIYTEDAQKIGAIPVP